MTRLLLVLFIAVTVTACSSPGVPVARTCANSSAERYFPAGSFKDLVRDLPYAFPWNNRDSDLFARRRFALYLSAMREPSLSCGASQDDETYRFLLLPSFSGAIAVRISRRGHRYPLEAVVLDREQGADHPTNGMAGYGPGKIANRVTKELTGAQWRSVVVALRDARFWRRKTGVRDFIGIDGSDFVIEARREGRYHVVSRWAGADGTLELGNLFLDLAGLNEA